jgi:hypothetical protein
VAAAMVVCVICMREHAKAVSTPVRGPAGPAFMCAECFDKLTPSLKKELGV